MKKTAMIRACVDPVLKDEVESLFAQLGLSATEVITLFYQQVSSTEACLLRCASTQ